MIRSSESVAEPGGFFAPVFTLRAGAQPANKKSGRNKEKSDG